MAVTILQSPADVTSGFDPQIFVVSASDSYLTTFRYKIEILIDAVSVAQFIQVKRPNGNALFDAQRTIENYLSYSSTNLIAKNYGWRDSPNNIYCRYQVKFTSQSYSGGTWSDTGNTTSGYKIAINSSLPYVNWIKDNLVTRQLGIDAAQKYFCTNMPNTTIRTGDSFEIGVMNIIADSCKYLVIRTYDLNGTLLKTGKIQNGNIPFVNYDDRFISILCGAADLNASTLASGTQPLIGSTTAYYDLTIEDVFGTETNSPYKRFTIDRSCIKDKYYRLYWLNPYGRFDAFNFTQVSDKSISVEQSKYNQLLGTETTSTFTYKESEHQKGVFFSEVETSYKLRSGYVNTETAEWLKELYASPLVYMVIDGYFMGITLKDTSYQIKTTLQEKLFNIELNVALSVNQQMQRL